MSDQLADALRWADEVDDLSERSLTAIRHLAEAAREHVSCGDRRKADASSPRWMGEWDEWVSVYNQLPVVTRAALAHLHGRHANLTTHCPLCEETADE